MKDKNGELVYMKVAEHKLHKSTLLPTSCLFGHQGSGHDCAQQFGHRHPNTIVRSFQGFETQSGHVLQFRGPHEYCLILQLQQALIRQEE